MLIKGQLWCWIDDNWNSLRIFSYYIPIWVCIFLSAVIYVAVGYHVFHQRNQLRNLTLSNQGKDVSLSDVRDSAEKVRGELFPSLHFHSSHLHATPLRSRSKLH